MSVDIKHLIKYFEAKFELQTTESINAGYFLLKPIVSCRSGNIECISVSDPRCYMFTGSGPGLPDEMAEVTDCGLNINCYRTRKVKIHIAMSCGRQWNAYPGQTNNRSGGGGWYNTNNGQVMTTSIGTDNKLEVDNTLTITWTLQNHPTPGASNRYGFELVHSG